MRKNVILLSAVFCLISSVCFAGGNSSKYELDLLRKSLLEENTAPRYGTIIKDDDPSMQAINRLEAISSKEAIDILSRISQIVCDIETSI